MNKLVRGKTSLIIVSVSMILLSVLLVGGSAGLIVWGSKSLSDSLALGIVLIIIGSLLAITFLGGIVYGFILYFTGKSLVAINGGNIAEDNSLTKGTANMTKCSNCGEPLSKDDKFCGKCGKSTSEFKKCEKCGVLNKSDANVCTACGEKLK